MGNAGSAYMDWLLQLLNFLPYHSVGDLSPRTNTLNGITLEGARFLYGLFLGCCKLLLPDVL